MLGIAWLTAVITHPPGFQKSVVRLLGPIDYAVVLFDIIPHLLNTDRFVRADPVLQFLSLLSTQITLAPLLAQP